MPAAAAAGWFREMLEVLLVPVPQTNQLAAEKYMRDGDHSRVDVLNSICTVLRPKLVSSGDSGGHSAEQLSPYDINRLR